jgi:hypothetical protein
MILATYPVGKLFVCIGIDPHHPCNCTCLAFARWSDALKGTFVQFCFDHAPPHCCWNLYREDIDGPMNIGKYISPDFDIVEFHSLDEAEEKK